MLDCGCKCEHCKGGICVTRLVVLVCVVVLALPPPAEATALTDAGAKWAAGDKAGAIADWQKVIDTSTEPNVIGQARSRLANALLSKGDTAGAVAVWKALAGSSADAGLRANAKMRLAYALVKTKAPAAQQLDAFMRVVTEHPTSPEARACLLRVAYLKEKASPTEALAAFAEVSARYPGTAEAVEADYRRGLTMEAGRKDIDAAIEAFDGVAASKSASRVMRESAAVEAGYARIMKYMGSASREDLQDAARRISATLPTLTNRELRARAYLALGECYLILDKQVPEDAPPDDAEAATREAAQYSVQAQQAYEAALASADSAYVRGIAKYGLGYSLMFQSRWDEAEKCFAELLAGMSGDTLKQKQMAWQKLGAERTVTGRPASWNLTPAWGKLIQMGAYWRAECLSSLERGAEAGELLSEVVGEFGRDKPTHWTVATAQSKLSTSEGGAAR